MFVLSAQKQVYSLNTTVTLWMHKYICGLIPTVYTTLVEWLNSSTKKGSSSLQRSQNPWLLLQSPPWERETIKQPPVRFHNNCPHHMACLCFTGFESDNVNNQRQRNQPAAQCWDSRYTTTASLTALSFPPHNDSRPPSVFTLWVRLWA